MGKKKLIQLLKLLSKKEIRMLKGSVKSPLLNPGSSAVELLHILLNEKNNWDKPQLTQEKICKKLYQSTTKADLTRLRENTSRLINTIEQFLAFQTLKNNRTETSKQLVFAYEERNAFDLLSKEYEKAGKRIKENPVQNFEDFWNLTFFEHYYYFRPDSSRANKSIGQQLKYMHYLDRFYVLTKLFYSCEIFSRKKIFPTDTKVLLLDKIETLVQQFKSEPKNILFEIYANLLSILKTGYNHQLYHHSKTLLISHFKHIKLKEQRFLLMLFSNIAHQQYKLEQGKDMQEIFDFFLLGWQYKTFIIYNRISDETFINAVVTSLSLKRKEWAEKFIEEAKFYLDPSLKSATLKLCHAHFFWYEKDYKSIISLLNKEMEVKKATYTLRMKSLLTRSYYEVWKTDNIQYEDKLEKHLDNFRKFIANSPKAKALTISPLYKIFIQQVKKLVKATNNPNLQLEDIKIWEDKLIEQRPFPLDTWVLEKLNEIKKKKKA